MKSEPHQLYYSAHHFARDLFGNAAIFTFFTCLGVLLYPNLNQWANAQIDRLADLESAPLEIALLSTFVLFAAVSGLLAERLTTIVLELPTKVRHLWRSHGLSRSSRQNECTSDLSPHVEPSSWIKLRYEDWYQEDLENITRFHDDVFGGLSRALYHPKNRGLDPIIRLTVLFKIHNPEGYAHVFRTYSFVAMIKQALCYVVLLSSCGLAFEASVGWFVLPALLVGLLVLLRSSLRHSVRREYAFLAGTARWIQTNKPP